MLNSRALALATLLGTVLQVMMVVLGHSNTAIAALFAVGGMGFSLIAGVAYTRLAGRGPFTSLAVGGAIAGAACALIGIFVSYMLGDVPASLLALGTISSAVTGAIGGMLGRFIARPGTAAAAALVLVLIHPFVTDAQPSTGQPAMAERIKGVTVNDFSWLAGRWQGRVGSAGGIADITFRHFSSALEAYEPSFKQTMRLTSSSRRLAV